VSANTVSADTVSGAAALAFDCSLHVLPNGACLVPMARHDAEYLAAELAMIDPWRRLGIGPARLRRALSVDCTSDGNRRFALRRDDTLMGAVDIVPNWLVGPYLRLLAVLPAYQGQGHGRQILAWVETQARLSGARNLWVCVSSFNDPAQALYRTSGFTDAAALPDLLVDGEHEHLMRKRLVAQPASSAAPKAGTS
jgi:ribosomal protein S18 acetylase RimI-like enzyme